MDMKIEIVKVGYLECNCYLVEINNIVIVIDPGDDIDKITKMIGNREVSFVIITHYHFDHIGALNDLVNKYKCKVYDRNNLLEGENIIDDIKLEVIYTPGHKEDLITIYFRKDKCMFCGDFIFRGSIGRWDMSGGNIIDMEKSIDKIKKYDRDTTIYPGHGCMTSLGYEIDNNIYFK